MSAPRWIRATFLPAVIGVLLAGGLLLSAGTVRAGQDAGQAAVPAEPEGNKACLECHSKDAVMTRGGREISVHVDPQQYTDSVHGIISCVRCHAEVTADHAKDPKRPLNLPTGRELRVLKSAGCVKCHAGTYEQSYKVSFHGVAVASGDNRAATCVDCHGVHNIQPSRNAISTVAPGNLPGTCGAAQCHPGAPANFAAGTEHFVASARTAPPALHIVYKFFMVLILFDTMKDGPIVMFELLRRLQHARRH